MTIKISVLLAFILALACRAQFVPVFAASVPLYEKDCQRGFYRYELANGKGFLSTVLKNGTSNSFVMFKFDEELQWSFNHNGNDFAYENESLIKQGGRYKVMICSQEDCAEFNFHIVSSDELESLNNELGDVLAAQKNLKEVKLSPEFYRESKMFCYKFPNGAKFLTNAPNGAVVLDNFRIQFSDEQLVLMCYNGKAVEYINGSTLRDEGVYNFKVVQCSRNAKGAVQEMSAAEFSIRILRQPSNLLDIVWAPQDFSIVKILKNGENLTVADKNYARLLSDGKYEFEFEANFDKHVKYIESINRKTQQPILVFSRFGLDGYSEKPVYYKLRDAACHLSVKKNGIPTENVGIAFEVGNYLFKVWDDAGNIREYSLYLDCRPNFCYAYLILILAVPAGYAFWFWLRRNAKVRVI